MSGTSQLALFAVVMLIAAAFMLRDRAPRRPRAAPAGPARLPFALIAAEGLAVGVLTGLVGVGGGFLIVPALVLLSGLEMKQAVGTSLVVIAVKSAAGFIGYLDQVVVPWAFMALFTAVAIAGIAGGAWLVRFVSQHALRRTFGVFLLIMGGFILFQNRSAFVVPGEAALRAEQPAAPRAPGQEDLR
jgi:uncharacterized protein